MNHLLWQYHFTLKVSEEEKIKIKTRIIYFAKQFLKKTKNLLFFFLSFILKPSNEHFVAAGEEKKKKLIFLVFLSFGPKFKSTSGL